jgi:nitrate reductase beta subunit
MALVSALGAGGRAFKSPRPTNFPLILKELFDPVFIAFAYPLPRLCQHCAKTPLSLAALCQNSTRLRLPGV